MGRLDGRTALITGGASGFGRAMAKAFLDEGAAVTIADIDETQAQETADALDRRSGRIEAMTADVTSPAALTAVVAATEAKFGGLSILVANAGVGQRPVRASETDPALMRRHFEVNAIGLAITCQAALPALRRHGAGASIILTLSGLALQPRPEFCAYGMAKAAGAYLMKALAQDLAPEGIRVNGLFPAVSDTPMFEAFSDGDPGKAAVFAEKMPLGRLITPEDVAAASVFLASPIEAGAVTGLALPIDGGRSN